MTRPWLERWRLDVPSAGEGRSLIHVDGKPNALVVIDECLTSPEGDIVARAAPPKRSALIAAAPAMVRALLASEATNNSGFDAAQIVCGCCEREHDHGWPADWRGQQRHPTHAVVVTYRHTPTCELDAVLTAVGLDTPEKREAARADIAAMEKR